MASEEGRPAQPKSILRGHKAQVHAAAFVRENERLMTGDADGFVVAWDLTIMRPRAVWQAHANSILGIAGWAPDRLITHGRDNKLVVWKFAAGDEARLSTKLPLDPSPEPRPQPWILYILDVNTMNFCSFSHCPASPDSGAASSEILVAVPNTLASEAIDIFHLPSQARRHTVKLGEKNGMVMALSLFHLGQSLTLVAGYENGLALVAQLDDHGGWTVKYQATCHTQPVLSLDVSPARDFFLTSSADAIIAKHPLPPPSSPSAGPQEELHRQTPQPPPPPPPQPNPPSAAATTASTPAPKSLLTAALATTTTNNSTKNPTAATTTTTTTNPPTPQPVQTENQIRTQPLQVRNTRHAGQQALRIRSDGRVFATAGWDARVRVYAARTLAEVAVLKWHAAGCYAAAFADVVLEGQEGSRGQGPGSQGEGQGQGSHGEGQGNRRRSGGEEEGGGGERDEEDGREGEGVADRDPRVRGQDGATEGESEGGGDGAAAAEVVVSRAAPVPRLVEMSVREKRVRQARTAHWLAAGSKDGKVSLWDVF